MKFLSDCERESEMFIDDKGQAVFMGAITLIGVSAIKNTHSDPSPHMLICMTKVWPIPKS